MILDAHRDRPGFPFNGYFDDPTQFIGAQAYWLAVLRSVEEWREAEWGPKFDDAVDASQRADGLVVAIRHVREPKEIHLHTVSPEGMVEAMLRDNAGTSAAEAAAAGMDAIAVPALGLAEARAEVAAVWDPFTVAVEDVAQWIPDARHPDGGIERQAERLVIAAHVAEQTERSVRQAVSLFLQDGPAEARVHDAFPDGEG